jgi:hypothetical protein
LLHSVSTVAAPLRTTSPHGRARTPRSSTCSAPLAAAARDRV